MWTRCQICYKLFSVNVCSPAAAAVLGNWNFKQWGSAEGKGGVDWVGVYSPAVFLLFLPDLLLLPPFTVFLDCTLKPCSTTYLASLKVLLLGIVHGNNADMYHKDTLMYPYSVPIVICRHSKWFKLYYNGKPVRRKPYVYRNDNTREKAYGNSWNEYLR